jgi:hypothetical protein
MVVTDEPATGAEMDRPGSIVAPNKAALFAALPFTFAPSIGRGTGIAGGLPLTQLLF